MSHLLQRAVQCYETERFSEAEMLCRQVLEFNSDDGEAIHLLGVINYQKGNFAAAHQLIKQAVSLNPRDARFLNSLGILLKETGNLGQALKCYQQALELDNENPRTLNNMGFLLKELKRLDEARECLSRSVSLLSNYPDAHNNLGTVLYEQGRWEEAVRCYETAISLQPDHAMAYSNLGKVFLERGGLLEAANHCRKAIRLEPRLAVAHNNLGASLIKMNQFSQGIESLRKSISLQADLASAHYNLACALLTIGDFKEGWKEYEWRDCGHKAAKRNGVLFSRPRWTGEPAVKQTILVCSEQGIGDTIQFIRYLPLVKARVARLVFACSPALTRLFSSLPYVDLLVDGSNPPKPKTDFDTYIHLLSLPRIFFTTLSNIPKETPYIHVDSQGTNKWRGRINTDTSNVGLVWAGNPNHSNDYNRSLSLHRFAGLGNLDHITFYSLQKGPPAEEAKSPPKGLSLVDYTHHLKDFADTAELISCLDLVISADTAVTHLAGAMGKPVWILLPFNPDWRWMLERTDSPWYPSATLFRQTKPGIWEDVINAIYDRLALTNNSRPIPTHSLAR